MVMKLPHYFILAFTACGQMCWFLAKYCRGTA